MTLLPALALALADDARTPEVPLPESRRFALRGPPLRLSVGSRMRAESQAAGRVEGRIQAVRSDAFTLDLAVGGSPMRQLDLLGPPRHLTSADAGVDLAWTPSPWFAVGPSVGLAYRTFGQQWTRIDDGWMPLAGLHLTAFAVRARTWGVAVRARAVADLGVTELVLDTAAVERLSPFEGGLDLEFHFGHGRPRVAR